MLNPEAIRCLPARVGESAATFPPYEGPPGDAVRDRTNPERTPQYGKLARYA